MQFALPPPNHVEFISKKELCLRLGWSKSTLERNMQRRMIPYFKGGSKPRCPVWFDWGKVVDALACYEFPARGTAKASKH